MENVSLHFLGGLLFALIILSGFFSSSETSMMSLNPYRLRHLSKHKRSARLVQKLLKRPDRLLGVILLGNNFVNILAASLATLIAQQLGFNVVAASALLTAVILIFAEVSPKTFATIHPEWIAFPASFILQFLLWVFYPLVYLVNVLSNGFLRIFGIKMNRASSAHLSPEELRTLMREATGMIPGEHRNMLISILDLEQVSVDDIMIPNSEIIAIDLESSIQEIFGLLSNIQHTYLPVYEGDINELKGILHVRAAVNLLAEVDNVTKEMIIDVLEEPYFVPESTSLMKQLIEFREKSRRLALVVNEYGDVQGLITLEDILEEIVGEFTTDLASTSKDIHPQEDGSYLVDGSLTLRELSRTIKWAKFPNKGPKTLSGLIIDRLQTIPEIGTCCLINNIPMEVVQVSDNKIKTIKLGQPLPK